MLVYINMKRRKPFHSKTTYLLYAHSKVAVSCIVAAVHLEYVNRKHQYGFKHDGPAQNFSMHIIYVHNITISF